MSVIDAMRKALAWEAKLIEHLSKRETLAVGATGEQWVAVQGSDPGSHVRTQDPGSIEIAHVRGDINAWFIAANDPAHVLRQINAHASLCNRHRLDFRADAGAVVCAYCGDVYPCPDVRDVAGIHGLEWM